MRDAKRLRGRFAAVVAAVVGLASACASSHPQDNGLTRAVGGTTAGINDAALTPLSDLNLRRVEIPPLLASILHPYEPLATPTCGSIARIVSDLTAILGPDADAPPRPGDTLDQQLGDEAARLALNTVSSTMNSMIPFRSVVRQVTGATAHGRRLQDAYERGVQRRSYLKGVGAAMGCAPPAAPDPSAGLRPPR